MRRLPIFFLIDVSESMVGEPIRNVNDGISMIISNLKGNPMALETAYISIIAFAGKAKTLVPLTDILKFNPTNLPIGGGTALGNAMNYLMDEIDKKVLKTTYEKKGDWKPIIFLLTDGSPTDQYELSLKRWKTEFKNKVSFIAISLGDQADVSVLREFTDQVLIFKKTDTKSFTEFFKWVSASIETKSRNIELGTEDEISLQNLNKDILQKDDKKERKKVRSDERFAILLARCQNTKKPYLIKFERDSNKNYNYKDSYPISEDYFELSSGQSAIVRSENLLGTPKCAYCKNFLWGMCACGKGLCLKSNNPRNKCPWCGQLGLYQIGNFDVKQTQG